MTDLSLKGKTAIVTGGSKGIGFAIAQAFATHGANVVIAARGQEALDAAQSNLAAPGDCVLALNADMANESDLVRIVEEAVATFGGVDVLVNNAGMGNAVPLVEETFEDFSRVMDVNLWAPIRLTQLCEPHMAKRGGGVIINIASNGGNKPVAGLGTYCLAKGALMLVSDQTALELGQDGIRCVSLSPGVVRTDLAAPIVGLINKYKLRVTPIGEIGEPDDIAGLALLIASPAGRFLSGTNLVIDGGELLAGPFFQ